MTAPPPTVEQQIGHLIIRFLDASKQHFWGALAELDLTPPHGFALHHLSEPMAMRRLAEEMGYDASHITGIVDKLEARGLVARCPDPTDRRVKLLVVTEAGLELRAEVEHRAFRRLPALESLTPGQRLELCALLRLAVGDEAPGDDAPGDEAAPDELLERLIEGQSPGG